jgi:hypothetical protein
MIKKGLDKIDKTFWESQSTELNFLFLKALLHKDFLFQGTLLQKNVILK